MRDLLPPATRDPIGPGGWVLTHQASGTRTAGHASLMTCVEGELAVGNPQRSCVDVL